ncbi:MAG TPA: hypothetical protein VF215_16315 [Thermoanaerobaculia bacterium]
MTGADADRVLPQAIRTAELRVRLPRHHIAMLEYKTGQQHTTVSHALARELDGIASADAPEFCAAIPASPRHSSGRMPKTPQLPC